MNQRLCIVCHEVFDVTAGRHAAKTCSKACSVEHARRWQWLRDHPGEHEPSERTRDNRTWTKAEVRLLEWTWGRWDCERCEAEFGRSFGSVRIKAMRLGLGSVARGGLMLADLERLTGYSHSSIHAYAQHLGLDLRPCPSSLPQRQRPGRYAIDPEVAEQLIAWLRSQPVEPLRAKGRAWGTGPRPPACLCCGRTEIPHRARGLCGTCYRRYRDDDLFPRICGN